MPRPFDRMSVVDASAIEPAEVVSLGRSERAAIGDRTRAQRMHRLERT